LFIFLLLPLLLLLFHFCLEHEIQLLLFLFLIFELVSELLLILGSLRGLPLLLRYSESLLQFLLLLLFLEAL